MSREDQGYQRTFLDRTGPDGVFVIRLCVLGILLGVLAASMLKFAKAPPLAIFFGGVVGGLVGGLTVLVIMKGVGRAMLAFIQPSGRSTPYERQYSEIEALAAAGRINEAIAAYEKIAVTEPGNSEVRCRAAELLAGPGGDPVRAAALLKEVQSTQGIPPERDTYVMNRLADLYLGPLSDAGKALVQLRRLAERYPRSAAATGARKAIAAIKERFGVGAADGGGSTALPLAERRAPVKPRPGSDQDI